MPDPRHISPGSNDILLLVGTMKARIITELGEVRPHINIFVDGENIHHSGELGTTLRGNAEVVILPALSGG
jgi:molybdopterin converting factor small subunit